MNVPDPRQDHPGAMTLDRGLMEGMLFLDQYELTMAQLLYRAGIHERPAVFEYSFRDYPDYGSHKAGSCIRPARQPSAGSR